VTHTLRSEQGTSDPAGTTSAAPVSQPLDTSTVKLTANLSEDKVAVQQRSMSGRFGSRSRRSNGYSVLFTPACSSPLPSRCVPARCGVSSIERSSVTRRRRWTRVLTSVRVPGRALRRGCCDVMGRWRAPRHLRARRVPNRFRWLSGRQRQRFPPFAPGREAGA
jgi:hypothetical protein